MTIIKSDLTILAIVIIVAKLFFRHHGAAAAGGVGVGVRVGALNPKPYTLNRVGGSEYRPCRCLGAKADVKRGLKKKG